MAASVFTIGSTSTDAGTQFKLNFPAVASRLYRFSESTDLVTWTPLVPDILATVTGSEAETIPLNGDTRLFFRVEIVPW